MPVTVLYPEVRQQPDNLETEVFGPDLRIVKRDTGALAELSDADCAEADGLMIMGFGVTGADLARFPRLRAIVRMGVGYDKLDRPAAASRNILICNVPDYGTTEVADHAIALALTLRRGILLHHELQRKDPPAPFRSFQNPLIQRLGTQTFGMLGLGRTGTRHRAGGDPRRPPAPDRHAVDPRALNPGNPRHPRQGAARPLARGRGRRQRRARPDPRSRCARRPPALGAYRRCRARRPAGRAAGRADPRAVARLSRPRALARRAPRDHHALGLADAAFLGRYPPQ